MMHSITILCIECHYAECSFAYCLDATCHDAHIYIFILSVIILSVVGQHNETQNDGGKHYAECSIFNNYAECRCAECLLSLSKIIGGLYHKPYYGCNLRISVISYVCPWQAFPA